MFYDGSRQTDDSMTAVIIGAGRIGSSVLELAADADVGVTVIERDHERAHNLDTSDDCHVIHDDATQRDTLHEAGVSDADAVIASSSVVAMTASASLTPASWSVSRSVASS